MSRLRFIHCAEGDCLGESIAIISDFDVSAEDFCAPGQRVVSDTIHDIDLPSSFPIDSSFKKEF
jgi:hypothetical protein